MTKIILTVSCIGKTYLDQRCSNVYDFDKHALDYNYDRSSYENLTDEVFKSLKNRKIRDEWLNRCVESWCKVIDSEKYDIVTGWLQDDCIEYLVKKGYDIELILVDATQDVETYRRRALARGNSERYSENMLAYYNETLMKYRDRTDMKITAFERPFYLSEYLMFSGYELKLLNELEFNYVTYLNEKIQEKFVSDKIEFDRQRLPWYSNLIFNILQTDAMITEKMIFDTETIAAVTLYHSYHRYMTVSPNNDRFDEVLTKKKECLNEILQYLRDLRRVIDRKDAKEF